MTLLLVLSFAHAAEPAPQAPSPGALSADVYFDTSLSTNGRREDDLALADGLRAGLREDDRLRIMGFDGTLHPILEATAPSAANLAEAFKTVAYNGLATFFAPIWFDVASRAGAADGRTQVVIVVTDGISDPLNRAEKVRPQVDDPSWKDSPPAALAGTPVIWVLRDDRSKAKKGQQDLPTLAFTGGSVPAPWTEPSGGRESTLLFWNPPWDWTAPTTADLAAWVTSLRPPPPPPQFEEPTPDWAALGGDALMAVGGLAGFAGIVLGGLVVRRKAAEKALTVARDLETKTADRRLRASATRRTELRLEPMGFAGEAVRREVRPGDEIHVGPSASWPGIPLPLPGSGFSIQIGSRPDRATIRSRGTRAGVKLLRKGYVVPLGPDASVEFGDGDVVIDARNETPLVRIRLGEEAAVAK